MSATIIREIEQSQMKTDLPELHVGDTVDVHVRIIEGVKERIQIFGGVIIKIQGTGLTRSMTVRRIVANEGVERTFPLHSPRLAKIEIKRHGHTRRARLYYLRDRVGKKRRLRDRRRGLGISVRKEKKSTKAVVTDTAQQAPAEEIQQPEQADTTDAQTTGHDGEQGENSES